MLLEILQLFPFLSSKIQTTHLYRLSGDRERSKYTKVWNGQRVSWPKLQRNLPVVPPRHADSFGFIAEVLSSFYLRSPAQCRWTEVYLRCSQHWKNAFEKSETSLSRDSAPVAITIFIWLSRLSSMLCLESQVTVDFLNLHFKHQLWYYFTFQK